MSLTLSPLKKNKDAWPLVQFYVDCHNVDANHIRAYDEFIEKASHMINASVTVGDTTVRLYNLQLVAPYIISEGKKVDVYPSQSIEQKDTYCSEMYCDMEVVSQFTQPSELSDEEIFKTVIKSLTNKKLKTIKTRDPKIILKVVKEHIKPDKCDFPIDDEDRHMADECQCSGDKWFHTLERIKSLISQSLEGEEKRDRKIFERVHIGSIPVMVGSCLCNLRNGDPPKEILEKEFKFGLGGYFVQKGTSRFIMFQERSTFGRFMTFDDSAKAKNKKFLKSVEIRISATDDAPTSLVTLGIDKSNTILVNMKYLQEKKYIPAVHFYYAMGITDPEEILSYIIDKDDPFFEKAAPHLLRFFENGETSDHIDEIGSLGKDKVNDKQIHVDLILQKHFMHQYKDFPSKARYFGFMILTLLKFSEGLIPPEDRDHFGRKVLDTEAALFSNVFYTAMRKTMAEISSNLEKSTKNLTAKILFPYKDTSKMPITSGFLKALSVNNWGGTEKKDGISQVLKPHNYAGAIISLQRCMLQLKTMNKKKKPRMVHGSMYGIIDLFDTPEGEKVGFIKVLAALCYIANSLNIKNVLEYIMKHAKAISSKIDKADKKIFVDNRWVAVTSKENAIKIADKLKRSKRSYKIEPTCSIVWNDIREELHIHSQGGRLMRAWLVVEDGELVYNTLAQKVLLASQSSPVWNNFEEAISSGAIEMLDQNELEFSMIATSIEEFYELSLEERKEVQYCDIHPATILGAGAGCITDPSRNQGPRNAYGANMKRQAVGTVGRAGGERNLFYPQRALVENKLANVLLKYDQYPAGMNIPIAFCPYKGMTIEDGCVVSKAAIEMGLFWTDKVTTHVVEISDPESEFIEIPDPAHCFKYRSYRNHNLGSDGIIKIKSIVQENDVLCGMTKLYDGTKPKIDKSLLYSESNRAYVKDVSIIDRGWKGSKIIKISTVEIKIPEWGNKITPLCAQKTTIAEIAQVEDMPFSPYPGEAPNPVVIYGPLCLPSRMTISLLYEMFLGQYVAACDLKRVLRGKRGKYAHNGTEDCTQFDGNDEEKLEWVMNKLAEYGYRRDGCLELYNGMTGKPIVTQIWIGMAHFQVLKHYSSEKINVRAQGPVEQIMRIPTHGRKSTGGASAVRVGNMETACLIANGVSHIILDRMCLSASKFVTTTCITCGILESVNSSKNGRCRICKKDNSMVVVIMPYPMKVVIQELLSLNIAMRILTAPAKSGAIIQPRLKDTLEIKLLKDNPEKPKKKLLKDKPLEIKLLKDDPKSKDLILEKKLSKKNKK